MIRAPVIDFKSTCSDYFLNSTPKTQNQQEFPIMTEATDAITELVALKSKMEQETAAIGEENQKLGEQLKAIRQEKEDQQAKNLAMMLEIHDFRVQISGLKHRVELLAKYDAEMKGDFESGASNVISQLNMSAFSDSILHLVDAIETAVSYYGDDNLRMELLKRTDQNRDLRVELTRLSNEIELKEKQIEAEKEEKRRIKEAELAMERQKEEEERKRAEAAKKPSPLPVVPMSPFRSIAFATHSPEQQLVLNAPTFSREGPLLPSDTTKSGEAIPRGKFSSFIPTFSQITRGW